VSNQPSSYVGRPLERVEDAALLTGRGRYGDDVPTSPRTVHAAILRSPHAHAEIVAIDASPALAAGALAVLTGDDVRLLSDPFLVALKQPLDQWSLAVGKVRYVGEPVALVVAADRYAAEDALEHVAVAYRELPAVADPEAAARPDAPVLHEAAGTNLVSTRDFRYGDPDAAFAAADRRVSLVSRFPGHSYMPIECFVVVAEHRPDDDSYDVLSSFQGPYSIHPVMARALRVPGARLRLRTPRDSGGSFGIKLAVFPYIVLMALAARVVGRPVKWVEDRYEHLQAATSCPVRVTRVEAAVTRDGTITALRFDQMDDYGAFVRAPMPAPLYRMHGAMTGAYAVRNLAITSKVVVTNKMPAGLVRGFGGPQFYLALERLVQRIAVELGLDPLAVIRRNLVPADAFPYRAAAGALYDSGDYQTAIARAIGDGRLDDLQRRRDAARAGGRLYGIGFAAVVEPAMSNLGYLSTLLTARERERAGPKDGAVSLATVAVDAGGAVTVTADCMPQGQGHATVLAQIVADQLGLAPHQITVNLEHDTQKDQWSIAAGTYSARFAPGTAVAAQLAAQKIRAKLARIAAPRLNVPPDALTFAEGNIFPRDNPDNALAFARVAASVHWTPLGLPDGVEPSLRETGAWSPPELTATTPSDEINPALTYGFVFDMCGVEVDRDTAQVRIDRYVTMHDSGTLLNPKLAEGQVLGAFAQGVGTALYEAFEYDTRGGFLTATFADYLVPTVHEVPAPEVLHIATPSPLTPLGAKGMAEGNCMSTPVCLANAVADALGVADVALPMTPKRLHALMAGPEPSPGSLRSPPSPAMREREGARAATPRGKGDGARR
jgi:2-furoyl-CoA dehydrogenase large subunit